LGEHQLENHQSSQAKTAGMEDKLMTMRLIVVVMLVALVCAPGPIQDSDPVSAQSRQPVREKSRGTARYACPMHPEVTSAKRGKCPKCGMALRLVEAKVTVPPTENNEPALSADTSSFSSARIPDVRVYDQNGNKLNFFRDLVKGKTVAINFIFTTCTAICPVLTATFRRVQQDAVERNLEVQLISISVDPTTDTPERLHDFAAKFKAGPGWTFVTGDTSEIDLLLKALGVAVANKNDHTPMILIGNAERDYWTRAYGASSPRILLDAIAAARNGK
jgi:cytochrome oxidase Cu insertion factor (SCO1/SenC/PrrC family)